MAVKHKPTPDNLKIVRALAMSGFRDTEIAEVIGCAESTLQKYYAAELKEGRKVANAKVVSALFNNAMKGNVSAQIFWCKARLGWRETIVQEHTGKDGGPIQSETIDRTPRMTRDQWLINAANDLKRPDIAGDVDGDDDE